ncbi:MAG TPA: ABC transporter ATP-binding protein [Acidimicrobiales bacterium]|nr:ABC transporter ATP-binding protein [Acidimicrobiales bacterium]
MSLTVSNRRPSSDGRPAIVVDNVSKRFRLYREKPSSVKERFTKLRGAVYEEYWALKDVSIEVPRGTTYGLVGSNGSGKSTMLRVMAGIHRPTSGSVNVDGRVSALLELGAGFHPELTGRENIYLNAAILGLTRKTIAAKMDDIIEFAGLGAFVDSPVKVYSSGMFVRLGFSVAVHVEPEVLLVDEVIAVGDEDFQRRCFDHLYKLRNSGSTIVLVTHDLGLVQGMCDNAAWLDKGVLKKVGRAPDVVHAYLDQVNEVETKRIEEKSKPIEVTDAETVEAEDIADVRSSHDLVEIEDVEFLDAEGRPTLTITPLEKLTMRVHWRAKVAQPEPLFSFAVENEAGVYVANPGMQPKPTWRDIPAGPGYVDYRMDELVLGPGQYTFTVAAHDHAGTTILHKRERFITLRVQPGNTLVLGLIDMMGTWVPPVSMAKDDDQFEVAPGPFDMAQEQ